jgi:hypothetical protein
MSTVEEVSKTEPAGYGITEEVTHTHFPVVAEGTGKTAANEGATEKAVYNVRQGRQQRGLVTV